jgi:hypothetical protein
METESITVQSRWYPHLDYYRTLEAVTFESDEDFRAVLKLFWNSPELFGVPRDIIAGRTIVVPSEVVHVLQPTELKFTHSRVLSAGELPANELAELRILSAIANG